MSSNTLMSAAIGGAGIRPFAPGRSIDELWVDPAGSNNYGRKSLSLDRPLATITQAIALAESTAAIRNRSTVIHAAPGEYREFVDVTKPDIAIIGSSGRHPGRTRIVGDGATVRATVRVLTGNLRGFTLANILVETGYPDTTSLAAPAIYLETSDTAELGANSTDEHFLLDNVQVISDGIPTAGLLLAGATMGRVQNSTFAGCVQGIVFAGSANNNPTDIRFHNIDLYNNVTADIATSSATPPAITLGSVTGMDSIIWTDINFCDVGGTPVTNYINMVGTQVNGSFFNSRFNRAVSDGTLTLLPAGVNIIGSYDPNGHVSIIGA